MRSIKPIKRSAINLRVIFSLALLIIFSYLLFKIAYKGDPLPPVVSASPAKDLIITPESGYHEFPVTVRIQNYTPGTVYSVDGSTPGLSSNFYTAPVIIKSSAVPNRLSFIPTSPRWFPPLETPERSALFFRASNLTVNGKLANQVSRLFLRSENQSALPVVSLTVNEDDFFSQQSGIYVLGERYEDKKYYMRHRLPLDTKWWYYPANYKNRGADSERPGFIEYIYKGKSVLVSTAGIRIRGNATRAFAQKSLTIDLGHAKKFSFFGDPMALTHSIVLRNGGNDWTRTMFRDELMQSIMSGFNLETQRYQPVILYINGEYWGVHNLRDHVDNEFLALKYKVPVDSITVLESPSVLKDGSEHLFWQFNRLLSEVRLKGCADTAVYAEVKREVDIENLTDYVIGNIYFANSDWPLNNCRFWRANTDSVKGKWRWILFDTDYGFGYTGPSAVTTDMFSQALRTSDLGVLLTGLLKNEDYRKYFTSRFRRHLETTFAPERVIRLIDGFEAGLAGEMPYHFERWRTQTSLAAWKKEVQVLRDFANQRHAVVSGQLDTYVKNNFTLQQ